MLCVDSDSIQLNNLERLFEPYAKKVYTATDPHEAIRIFKEKKPFIVVIGGGMATNYEGKKACFYIHDEIKNVSEAIPDIVIISINPEIVKECKKQHIKVHGLHEIEGEKLKEAFPHFK